MIVPELFHTLGELVMVLAQLLGQLLYLGLHYALLLLWLAWALFAINWRRTWVFLAEGAWAPVVLLSVLVALVWASLSPESAVVLGFLPLGSFWWKLGVVWIILALTCFCGWLQGVLNYHPAEISVEPPAAAADHGHHHHH